MLKKSLKLFFIMTLITIFCDGFAIFFSSSVYIRLFQIFTPICFLLFIALYKTKFMRLLTILYKKTAFKYLVWYILWMFISGTILLLLGETTPLVYYYIIVKRLIGILFIFLLIPYLVPKFLSMNSVIKIVINLFLFIYIFGIILFLGENFNITFLHNIQNFVSNVHYKLDGREYILGLSNIPRLRSIFHEPGSIAGIISLFLPIFYSIGLSKNQLYKNIRIDLFAKKSLIFLSWLCLILTQSPIYLIFACIITVLFFYKELSSLLKRIKPIILLGIISTFLIFLSSLLFLILTSDLEQLTQGTYLSRIITVLNNLKSINELILAEQSLGVRIVGVVNSVILTLKYPLHFFIGWGADNIRFFIYDQFLNSPLVVPPELLESMSNYTKKSGMGFTLVGFWNIFVDSGIIGLFLFYIYIFKTLILTKKLIPLFIGIQQNFLIGLYWFYIYLILFGWYHNPLGIYPTLLFGFTFTFYLLAKNKKT